MSTAYIYIQSKWIHKNSPFWVCPAFLEQEMHLQLLDSPRLHLCWCAVCSFTWQHLHMLGVCIFSSDQSPLSPLCWLFLLLVCPIESSIISHTGRCNTWLQQTEGLDLLCSCFAFHFCSGHSVFSHGWRIAQQWLAVFFFSVTSRQMKSKCQPTAHIKRSAYMNGVIFLYMPPKGKVAFCGLTVSHRKEWACI